jgi:hypothetical protein
VNIASRTGKGVSDVTSNPGGDTMAETPRTWRGGTPVSLVSTSFPARGDDSGVRRDRRAPSHRNNRADRKVTAGLRGLIGNARKSVS